MKFSLPLRSIATAVGLGSLLLSAACTYTKAEEEPIPKPCSINAATVSYLTDIRPIIQAKCQQCHSSVNKGAGGNHNWDNFSELRSYAVSGQLVRVLERKGIPESLYMPLGAAKLPICEIELIRAWADKGAPNN